MPLSLTANPPNTTHHIPSIPPIHILVVEAPGHHSWCDGCLQYSGCCCYWQGQWQPQAQTPPPSAALSIVLVEQTTQPLMVPLLPPSPSPPVLMVLDYDVLPHLHPIPSSATSVNSPCPLYAMMTLPSPWTLTVDPLPCPSLSPCDHFPHHHPHSPWTGAMLLLLLPWATTYPPPQEDSSACPALLLLLRPGYASSSPQDSCCCSSAAAAAAGLCLLPCACPDSFGGRVGGRDSSTVMDSSVHHHDLLPD